MSEYTVIFTLAITVDVDDAAAAEVEAIELAKNTSINSENCEISVFLDDIDVTEVKES